MEFEAYKHHIYFIVIAVFVGLALQIIIQKLMLSLNPDVRKNTGKTVNDARGFFSKVARIFSWTASLYLGCRMYYAHVLPDELFSFLIMVIRIESVVIVMFFLSHGINNILINLFTEKKYAPDGKILPHDTGKKPARFYSINPLSWVIAFIVSASGLHLIYFSSLINLLIFAAVFLFAIIFLYRSSAGGHQLVTGFIGYFYLKNEQKYCEPGQPFMLLLEDGRPYEVKKVSIFHTSFKTESNAIIVRNNSLLMTANFGFKEYEEKHNTDTHNFSFDKTNNLQYKKDGNG